MKIPIKAAAALERRIDRYVAQIEHAQTRLFYDRERAPASGAPSQHALYAAVKSADHPIGYREIAIRLGVSKEYRWTLNTHLSILEQRGFLRQNGNVHTDYFRDGIGGRAYEAVPPEEIPIIQRRVQKIIDKMLADTESMSQQVNEIPACIAQRVSLEPFMHSANSNPTRNKEIIQLRLAGMPLLAIGAKFGITRERVRQIVQTAVIGHDPRCSRKRQPSARRSLGT